MSLWKKLTYLVPSIRRAADRDMQEELESLEEIAGRRELGNLTLAAEAAHAEWGWTRLEQTVQDLRLQTRCHAVLRRSSSIASHSTSAEEASRGFHMTAPATGWGASGLYGAFS